MDLTQAPEALTAKQRAAYVAMAVLCAFSRLLAIAKSPWDWDEMLFALALGDYDIAQHRPHPPGFPLYVGAARVLRQVIDSDFRSYQVINVIAAMLLFPAMFMLAREIRLRFTTAMVASALFAFLPNVWFFGGTAFSDIPSVALVVFAVAALLRGIRSPRWYLAGAFVLALSAGIRSQNLLVGMLPGLLATRYRRPREIGAAALIGITVIVAAYGGAIAATGSLESYQSAIRNHAKYISEVDSFRSPNRPALWRITDRFFFKQYQWPPLGVACSLLVLVAIATSVKRRDRSATIIAAAFVPFAIFAWLMLDRYSVSRFSIGYQPMFAVLIAIGIRNLSRGRERVEAVCGAFLVIASAAWTLPALTPVRNEVSPPLQAVGSLLKQYDPTRQELFVSYSMTPFLDYLAPQLEYQRLLDDRGLPIDESPKERVFLAEVTKDPKGELFARKRGRLWNIARRHYFEVVIRKFDDPPQFGRGWYGPEHDGHESTRWMARQSEMELPARNGRTLLRVWTNVPDELVAAHASVAVSLNGAVIATKVAESNDLSFEVKTNAARSDGPNKLVISLSRAVPPHEGEERELGLKLRFLSWGPA